MPHLSNTGFFGLNERGLSQEELIRRGDIEGDRTGAQKAARKRQFQINQANEESRLRQLADQGVDLSFLTPEFEAAQKRTTIDPIQRSFGLARQQGLQQSLRTGGPVGALVTSLAGQEGDVLGEQTSRNFLTNIGFGADLAGRRFGQNLEAAGFRNQLLEQERAREERKQARGSKFGRFVGGVAGLAGRIAGAASGNPLSFLGGGGGGSTPQFNRNFSNLRG